MIVGFTGTRNGLTALQRETLVVALHRVGASVLHHGDCRGADEDAHAVGRQLGLRIIGHPPNASGLRAHCVCDELRAPAPFLIRNHHIVAETMMLIACPDDGRERLRSGTWSTVRHSRRLHQPRRIIDPYGNVETEGTTLPPPDTRGLPEVAGQ